MLKPKSLRNLHNIRVALHPSRCNREVPHPPQLALSHNASFILVPKEIVVLELRAGTLSTTEMLSHDTAGQLGGVAGNGAADVGGTVRRVQRSPHRVHQALDDRVSSIDRGVVHANFAEGREVHDGVVGER